MRILIILYVFRCARVKNTYFLRIAMSKQANTPPAKRGRPRVKISKSRPSITMNTEVFKTARKLANKEGMSFSGWLEQLVRNQAQPKTGGAES
jgi:hypothetical protein